jgi:wyosine [tRNA(Phe)-imidazoG37] synthetase (radical SAM superfamily)
MSREAAFRRVPPRENEIVYGPVLSRRLGISLGINLNLRTGKTCSFDCVYCQYGRTWNLVSKCDELKDWLDEDAVLDEVEAWLRRLRAGDRDLNSITFAGYGEPTLYPHLKDVVLGVKELRDDFFPGVQVDILTNSSIIPYKRVFEALRELDSVVAKLDAGRPETFEAINRPAKGVPNLKEVIESLIRLQEETGIVTLQTLIFRYADEKNRGNSSPDEIELIAEKAGQIDPVEVQVYTVSRLPSEPLAEPVDDHALMEATRKINQIMGKKCSKLYI